MERRNRYILFLIVIAILPFCSFISAGYEAFPDWLIEIPEFEKMPGNIEELDSMSRSTRRNLEKDQVLNYLMPIDYRGYCLYDTIYSYDSISYSLLGRISVSDTCMYVFFEKNYKICEKYRSVYMSACVANKRYGTNLKIYDSFYIRPDSLPLFSFKYDPDFPSIVSIYSSISDFDETKTTVTTDLYLLNSNLSAITNDYLMREWLFSRMYGYRFRDYSEYDNSVVESPEDLDNYVEDVVVKNNTPKEVMDFHGFIIPIQSAGSIISIEEFPYGSSEMPWDIVREYLWPTQNEIGARYPYGGASTTVRCYGIIKYEDLCLLLYAIDYPFKAFMIADLNTITPSQKYPKTLRVIDDDVYYCLTLEEIIEYFNETKQH